MARPWCCLVTSRGAAASAKVNVAVATQEPQLAQGQQAVSPQRTRRRQPPSRRAANVVASVAQRRRSHDFFPHGATGMSPSRPFILRPVATSLLMLAIVLAGL